MIGYLYRRVCLDIFLRRVQLPRRIGSGRRAYCLYSDQGKVMISYIQGILQF